VNEAINIKISSTKEKNTYWCVCFKQTSIKYPSLTFSSCSCSKTGPVQIFIDCDLFLLRKKLFWVEEIFKIYPWPTHRTIRGLNLDTLTRWMKSQL
jgi:hypothetical protein